MRRRFSTKSGESGTAARLPVKSGWQAIRAIALVFSLSLFARADEGSSNPPGYALLEKLNRIEEAGSPEDMRRNISDGMKALMEADRSEMMAAMNLVFSDRSRFWGVREMVVTQCLARYPEEPVFDPAKSDFQSMLASKNDRKWMAFSIAKAIGARWINRHGVKAIGRLGTLPQAQNLDRKLFEGMCKSAKTGDEHLALLTWYVGPGKNLDRFPKGYHPLWERLLTKSAELDLGKTRAWVEFHFPPRTMRKSDKDSDWDISNLRRALFDAWAKDEPLAAIQWNLAQYRDDDPDADWIYLSGVRHIADASDESLKAGLAWLRSFQDKPHFIKTVAELRGRASRERWDDSELRIIGAWMAALPLPMRERILTFAKDEYLLNRPRFAMKPDDRVVKLCCPDDKERKIVITHLAASVKQPDEVMEDYPYDAVGHEFNLPQRRMEKASTAEALATARRRSEQYAAVTTSLDPKERLDNLLVLEWLASASTAELRETLQAHLENLHGELDQWIPSGQFAMKLIGAWSLKDWQSCERFAWDAHMPEDTRRRILIYCFQYAADRHPDEIQARVAKLISDGKMWSLALIDDGEDVQWGGSCFAGRIPIHVGTGLALNDPDAVAKLTALPPEWRRGALKGASEAFTKAEIGLGLLDWMVKHEYDAPKASDARFAYPRNYSQQARTVIERLQSMRELDASSADAWLQRVQSVGTHGRDR